MLPMAYLLNDLLIIFSSEEDESFLTTLTISVSVGAAYLLVIPINQEGLSSWTVIFTSWNGIFVSVYIR